MSTAGRDAGPSRQHLLAEDGEARGALLAGGNTERRGHLRQLEGL